MKPKPFAYIAHAIVLAIAGITIASDPALFAALMILLAIIHHKFR